MKQKRIYMALALLLTVLAANAQNKVKAYFTTKEMPDMLNLLLPLQIAHRPHPHTMG